MREGTPLPDDDWALGQNEVDVRNEARNPLNAVPLDSRRPPCRCKIWEQRWREGAEHLCVNCGGLLPNATIGARR